MLKKIKNKLKESALLPEFYSDLAKFKKMNSERFPITLMPCLLDKTQETAFEPHYIYHPAWALRVVQENNPKLHIDFSSTLTFCSSLSAFIPTHFYDYRPANLKLSGLTTKQGDLTSINLPDNSVESLSCMHTVEHVGLGRYGDKLDPDGDIKAMKELKRVLAPGGSLLFVVPVGRSRIEFNAHRIYSYEQVIEQFSDLVLKEYSLIPDNAVEVGMIKNASAEITNSQNWGCGCFWFVKQ